LGRRQKKLLEARKEASSTSTIVSDDGGFFCHECDVSDDRWFGEVFDQIRDSTGPVRGLVNYAAINPSRNRITETDLDDWRATLEVNLTGAFNCSKAAVEQMLLGGGGSIVNIFSVGGLKSFRTRTPYNASKFGS
jgi:NAD(P)-dependent dehydrogenase (short-subunit alcohol dehydrogenase family)